MLLAGGVALGKHGHGKAVNVPNPNADRPQTVARERVEAERQRASRTSSAGRAARLASRRAYRGQSNREALATARKKFSGLLDSPALRWPTPRTGQKLGGYVNDYAGVVLEGSGRRGVVESSIPLRGRTPAGHRGPIDLSLVDAGSSSYAPKSAAADVRIPDDARGKLRFPDQSFGVGLDGARAQGATVQSNKAFFANAATDADLVLEPQPLGAELSVVLRSPDAPSAIPLRFDLSGDQRLKLADGWGSDAAPANSAAIVDGGKQVAEIGPATAVDAQGRSLSVSYKLDGERLVMNVDTNGDVAWPVLVDPIIGVYDVNGTSAGSGNPDGWMWKNWAQTTYADPVGAPNTTWSWCNNAGSIVKKFYFCRGTLNGASFDGGPLYIKGNATQNYAASDWAEWVKYARPDSYIYGYDGTAISNVANHAQLLMGVWSANWGWETPGSVIWGNGSTSTDAAQAGTASYETYPGATISAATRYIRVHGGSPTPANPITPGNIAVFGIDMAAGVPGTPVPYIAMGGGATYSSETFAPDFTLVSHSNPPLGGWTSGYTDSLSASVHDRGLGMGTLTATGPNMPGTATKSACTQNGAPPNTSGLGAQNYYDSCVADLTMPYSSGTTYAAPQGINTYTVRATDLVGNSRDSTPWVAKVDSTPPSVTLSGSLYDGRGQTLPDGTYDLNVNATDGSHANAASERSGVQSIEIRVNGDQEEYWEQTCATSSCPMNQTWQFNTQDWPAQEQVITVVVTDQLDHSTTSEEIHVTPSGSNVPDIGLDVTDIAAEALTDPPLSVPDDFEPSQHVTPLADSLKQVANSLDDATTPSGTPIPGEDTAEADATEENVFVDDIGSSGTFAPAANNNTTRVGKNREGWASTPGQPDLTDPPDTTGAIGPDKYVEMTNQRVAIYRRSDMALLDSQPLSKFVNHVNDDVTDPQIQWDSESGRWLFAVLYNTPNGQHRLGYRWSKGQDPAFDNWCSTRFTAASGLEDDFPKLGHNKDFLIIGSNVFDETQNPHLQGSRIFVATKPRNGQSGCPSPAAHRFFPRTGYLMTADGHKAFTPVPANTIARPKSGYIVAADYPEFTSNTNQIMVWHISGSGSSPALTRDDNIGVTAYDTPPNIPQPGTNDKLDSSDTRLTQAVAAVDPDDGKLTIWTQHTIRGPENRAVVRWYELQPPRVAADPRAPRQQGTIQSAMHNVFNAAISPAANGNDAAIAYNVGGRAVKTRIRARTRHGNTLANTMLGEVTLLKSPEIDQSVDCKKPSKPCRWGDYAGASPDPSNSAIVWGSNQYVRALTGQSCTIVVKNDDGTQSTYHGPCAHWGTRNFALRGP